MSRTATEAERLAAGASTLGLELDPAQTTALLSHLELLYRWNPSAGLTAVAAGDAVRLHLLDSLSLAPHVDSGGKLVDLGSGGGFPGLPLALALPGLEVELVESRRRCCSFLAEAIVGLGLSGRATVSQADAHGLAGPYRTVVSRAFLPPPQLVRLATGLLEPGGRVLVMCSGRPELGGQELAQQSGGLKVEAEERLSLPGGDEGRSILVLVRPL